GGMTAAAILQALSPNYAWAEQVPEADKRIATMTLDYDSPKGQGKMKGYFAKPASLNGKVPGVVVVHENRGLTPYVKDVARRAAEGRRRREDQRAAADSLRRARRARERRVAGLRGGAEGERQEVRGVRVRRREPWLPQRHDAALRQGGRRAVVAAHDRFLQQ